MNKNSLEHKFLILPVEIKAREFDSRLLLGVQAIRSGMKVILGNKNKINQNIDRLPQGIYFEKSIAKNKQELLEKIVNQGHVLVNIDEEGLASANNTWVYLKQRVSESTLALVSHFYTWGEHEKNTLIQHFPAHQDKIITTGNPRVDLWKSSFKRIYNGKVEAYRKRLGDFLFLPSSFAVKHVRSQDFLLKQAKEYGIIENEEDENIFKEDQKFHEKVFYEYVKLAKFLAKQYPDKNIVVRPHPAEDQNFWKQETAEYDNLHVLFEGNVTPWIIASEAVVHSSCTTGLEAFLMNKPVISYLPYQDNEFINHIANAVSLTSSTKDGIKQLIDKVLEDGVEQNQKTELKKNIEPYLASLDKDFAFEKLIESFRTISPKVPDNQAPDYRFFYKKRLKQEVSKLKKTLLLKSQSTNLYKQQKFPSTSTREVKDIVRGYKLVEPALPAIRVKKLDENLFVLEAKL